MSGCVEKMVRLALDSGAPLLEDVVRSIAGVCNVDYGEVWRIASSLATAQRPVAAEEKPAAPQPQAAKRERPCWRCPVCGREFESYVKLVNHILYFVRRGDKLHRKAYYEIREEAARQGKRFSEIVAEKYRC